MNKQAYLRAVESARLADVEHCNAYTRYHRGEMSRMEYKVYVWALLAANSALNKAERAYFATLPIYEEC